MVVSCPHYHMSWSERQIAKPEVTGEKQGKGLARARKTKQIEMKKSKYKTGAWIGLLLDYCIRSTTWLGLILFLKERTTSSFRSPTKLEYIASSLFLYEMKDLVGLKSTFLPVVWMEGNYLFSALDKRMPPCLTLSNRSIVGKSSNWWSGVDWRISS